MDLTTIAVIGVVAVLVAIYFWPRRTKAILSDAEDVVRNKIDDLKK